MALNMLSEEEELALSQARAYSFPTVKSQFKPLPVDPSPYPSNRRGVHVMHNHRQGLAKYCSDGLWCNEEALLSREALQNWRSNLRLPNLHTHSVVAQGFTRLISTARRTTDDNHLLPLILQGDPRARLTADELALVAHEPIGLFALSYRHQGPKGHSLSPELWADVLSVADAVAACASFRAYALWIDCISAAAKSEPAVVGYIDWFTVGVAPYLMLPTIIMATERERNSRMWLRMEEKLSQYGDYCVYALRHGDAVVRLEPGPVEKRDPYERIWCLCQSVVRGEYNNLETSFQRDYLNLLEWATSFEHRQLDYRGLQLIFDEASSSTFRETLPIEKGCYIVLPTLTHIPWLNGAEMSAGRVEHLIAINDMDAIKRLRDDARLENANAPLFWLRLRNRRQIALQHLDSRSVEEHIKLRRWRSYATSTLLVVELTGGTWWRRETSIRRTILVGSGITNWSSKQWNFGSAHGLEVIPEPVRKLVGAENTTVSSVEQVTAKEFAERLSV